MGSQVIDFRDGMKIGRGYNRLTGEVLESPSVTGPSITAVQGAGGQLVTTKFSTIRDVEALHKSLGISVDAGGSYFGFSGSAKVDYVNSCDFSSYSIYVMVRVTVRGAFESIDAPVFSPDALELVANNNPDRFRERFGDSYIAGIQKGGEYFAIYQVTSSDESERESLATDVRSAFDGLLASAELNTSVRTAKSNSKSHLDVKVFTFRQGTISRAELDLGKIMEAAKQFPIDVSGDKAFPYAVLLEDYRGLKSPNDGFSYYDFKNQQDVLEDLAKKRFEFLALRDDLNYILKHTEDFQNPDGSSVDRAELTRSFDYAVDAINTMENDAKACARSADQCKFTTFDVAKIKLPILAKGLEDVLAARGEAIANQDPLAVALRNQQPPGPTRRGFDVGMAAAEGHTLPGPGKQKIHDSLKTMEQRGFEIAVEFSLERNKNIEFVNKGAAIAKEDPFIAESRMAETDPFYTLGFDIGAGLFGELALGGAAHTLEGSGSQAIRDALSSSAQRGFRAASDIYLVKKHRKS